MREGLPHCDTSLPDPATAGLKWWRGSSQQPLFRTEDEKRSWEKHCRDHLGEADKEFTEKILLAPPRDIPAETALWEDLSDPRTRRKAVQGICERSRILRFWFGQPPSISLYQHSKEFCRAKGDERYPDGGKQNRQSSNAKRTDYLARVMAGLSLRKPLAPATAVDILRKMKHARRCACWRCLAKRLSG